MTNNQWGNIIMGVNEDLYGNIYFINESNDFYKLEKETNGSGSWSEIYSGTALSFAVTGLTDSSYKFRVKACNIGGCSGNRTSTATLIAIKLGGFG